MVSIGATRCHFIIGTGMGGGLVIDDKLFRGANGIGAEFGHMIVQQNGVLCGCGTKGCIEQYASGSALMRYAKEGITANPAKGKVILDLAGGSVTGLTGAILTKAALAGDELAIAAFKQQADWLGSACASFSLILNPAAIVIGGGGGYGRDSRDERGSKKRDSGDDGKNSYGGRS